MKTIHIEAFDKSSVEAAIEEVKAIKKEWKTKAEKCEEIVAAELADIINRNLAAIPYTDDRIDLKAHQQIPIKRPAVASASGNKVMIQGEDIAFIEFGAGIYYNNGREPNPISQAVQFDTAIGSYGKGQGNKPYWFIAHNLISRGIPAYMPIANAIEEIKPQIPMLVRSVFV